MRQVTDTVFMVPPDGFRFNTDTAQTNTFQYPPDLAPEIIQARAQAEFWTMVQQLREAGVRVITDVPIRTPDGVFPNNWFLTSQEEITVCPMQSPSRRLERAAVSQLQSTLAAHGFAQATINSSLVDYEQAGQFLEGTGSIVFDHLNRKAYACYSPRTDEEVLERFCGDRGYQAVLFEAVDTDGQPIYHTNVMMSIGKGFAVICEEAIPDIGQRSQISLMLKEDRHQILPISQDQMEAFCGNILQLSTVTGESVIVLSEQAEQAFGLGHQAVLSRYGRLLPCAIPTIESVGGGSVRCMMAEIFLNRAQPS